MRHVDEGTIHAWLDQQVTDPQEVARITAHLRECATCNARIAEEEATIRDAEALLASVAPYADGSREAFEALVAGAAHWNGTAGHATSASTSTTSGPSYPWWIVSAGWAATIALAMGIGWSARYLMLPQSPVEQPAGSPVPQQMARTEAPPPQVPESREQDTTPAEPTVKTAQPSRVARARRQPPAAGEERVRSGAAANQGGVPGAADPTDTVDTTGRKPVELETTRSLSSLVALVPSLTPAPTPAPPPQAAAPFALPFRSETVEVTAEAPVVDVQNARQRQVLVPGSPATAEAPATLATSAASPSQPAPAPPAVAPAAGGGRGGRGGGGGGRGGRAAGAAPAAAGAVGQFAAGATDGLNQGRIAVDGLQIERADGIDWMVWPRETARERSGMSLYGIDGLTPSRTMVSADGSKVRTVYVVNAAEVVLLQERQQGSATAPTPTFRTGANVAAPDQQPAQAAPVRWSATRGDVVLTVQGADAAGFGARVRPD